MPSFSVGVIGVAGLSERGDAEMGEPAEGPPWSPEGPAGGSLVIAEVEEMQLSSLRRER